MPIHFHREVLPTHNFSVSPLQEPVLHSLSPAEFAHSDTELSDLPLYSTHFNTFFPEQLFKKTAIERKPPSFDQANSAGLSEFNCKYVNEGRRDYKNVRQICLSFDLPKGHKKRLLSVATEQPGRIDREDCSLRPAVTPNPDIHPLRG